VLAAPLPRLGYARFVSPPTAESLTVVRLSHATGSGVRALAFSGLLLGALVWTCPSAIASQEDERHPLIGIWDGPSGRIIDVWSVRADGAAQGTMGALGRGQRRAEIRVEGRRIRVVNATTDVFNLTLVNDAELTGTETVADGKTHPWTAIKRKMDPCTMRIPADVHPSDPPKYCVLDTWMFSDGRIQTVVSVSEDTVMMAGAGIGACPGCVFSFDKHLALRSIERPDGQPLEIAIGFRPIGDGWRFWDFPLLANKSWRISATGEYRQNL
jgi:hypothetical protein